jgi:hypothetical protein
VFYCALTTQRSAKIEKQRALPRRKPTVPILTQRGYRCRLLDLVLIKGFIGTATPASAGAVNVVSLTSDMTSLKNTVCTWIQGISSISDEYLTPELAVSLKEC